ncbi:clan AA aspartic protease [Tychonema sp. LEGE 07199]|uniref:clan AA aspartic protease n=1 Tax=unclassified Tychonema TaxID=2642144 RepID=UPI001881F7D6|nr:MULTISPECIES: clan AA aspartic protease [unclassified Tychonema]MBE9123254.1 clan AA aspartic protease [Tychonema sp. LEGE 07199]MBE9132764.1 clan AA aspartic protease [Tychonema sp. LEGE 07196]
MINIDRNWSQTTKNMGAVRVKVKLTNAIDEALVSRGLLNPNLLRVCEAEALIDTGAVRTAIPVEVCEHLGLRIRSQEIAKYADGRQETVGLTEPMIIEMAGRETIEAAMVLGDIVLIGQTVLETLDLLVDSKNQRLVPNPENPERAVLRV